MKIILALACLFYSLSGKSQSRDTTFYTCKYRFTWQTDSTRPKIKSDDIMLLRIKKSSSLYYSYLKQLGRQNRDKMVAEMEINSTGGTLKMGDMGEFAGKTFADKESEIIQINFESGKLEITDKLGPMKPLIAIETLEVPVWKLQNNTDTILGQICQEATTKFKGRNYTAWFAPSIPYSMGPWLLNGLPGLILRVADDKNEIAFECMELNVPVSYSSIYTAYENPKELTAKKLKELKALFKTDYHTFSKEIMGDDFTITDKNGNSVKSKPRPYNPIEKSN